MTAQLLRGVIAGLPPDPVSPRGSDAMLDMLRWRAEAFIEAHLADPSLDACQSAP